MSHDNVKPVSDQEYYAYEIAHDFLGWSQRGFELEPELRNLPIGKIALLYGDLAKHRAEAAKQRLEMVEKALEKKPSCKACNGSGYADYAAVPCDACHGKPWLIPS